MVLVGNVWLYDMCRFVKRAPRLTLAVNLFVPLITVLWLWLGFTQGLPSAVLLPVFIALLFTSAFAGYLLIETFYSFTCLESCAIFLFPVFLVFYWFGAMVSLLRVVLGKAQFPEHAP
jgi:hypothetical protein